MTKGKKLGIWMDHASAHLMEFTVDAMETKVVASKFTHEVKEHSISKGEHIMHNKEQHQQAEYYKQLGETIRNYDEVILFGPTDAKLELHNVLKADHRYQNIRINVQQADKMTEHQQHAFVKHYFSNQ
jgi:nitrogenase subunit NifH